MYHIIHICDRCKKEWRIRTANDPSVPSHAIMMTTFVLGKGDVTDFQRSSTDLCTPCYNDLLTRVKDFFDGK